MHPSQHPSRLHWLGDICEGHGPWQSHMEVPQHPAVFFPTSSLPCPRIPAPPQALLTSSHPLPCAVFFAELNISHRSAPLPPKANINLGFNHGNALRCPGNVSPGSAGHYEAICSGRWEVLPVAGIKGLKIADFLSSCRFHESDS